MLQIAASLIDNARVVIYLARIVNYNSRIIIYSFIVLTTVIMIVNYDC
jgi:hypothetical protein